MNETLSGLYKFKPLRYIFLYRRMCVKIVARAFITLMMTLELV